MKLVDLLEPDCPYCAASDTLQHAAERLSLWKLDALPVCSADRRVVGTVSSRSVCREASITRKPLYELPIITALDGGLGAVREDDPILHVMDRMLSERSWCLPVVDAGNALLGMVSYEALLGSVSGAREALVVVGGRERLTTLPIHCGVPTWILVEHQRELISPEAVPAQLSKAECRLLLAFARGTGQVLDREALTRVMLQRSWHPSDRYVDVVVASLRRKFGESGTDARVIRTVPNEGYVFTLKVLGYEPARGDADARTWRRAGGAPSAVPAD